MHWREKSILPLRQQLSPVFLLLLLLLCKPTSETHPAQLVQPERFQRLAPKVLLANLEAAGLGELGNNACLCDLQAYVKAIEQQEPWALRMLDASSKPPSGILQGNIFELGSYDECVSSRGEASAAGVKGQYCSYEIQEIKDRSIIPYNPSMSLCLPRSCTVNELARLVAAAASANATGSSAKLIQVPSDGAVCIDEEWKFWDAELLGLMSIVGAYIGFLIACTIRDLLERWSEPTTTLPSRLARFSFLRSSELILSVKPQKGNVAVINGIRFISSASIILLHDYIFHGLTVSVNVFYMAEWMSSFKSVPAIMASFSVDTFFTLSGFLMSCSYFRQKQKERFDVVRFYLHRFIRLTLPMVPVIFVAMILMPKLGSGPRWTWALETFLTACRSKWWSILLHVQNFVETHNYCHLELWSVSADMQLYTLSLPVLYFLHRKEKLGLIILASLISAPMIINAVLVGFNGYYMTYISPNVNVEFALKTFDNIYFMTYTRASPFFIGILLGYIVHNKSWKLTKSSIRTGWIATFISFLIFPLIIRFISDVNYKYILPLEMLGSAFARPVWSVLICWIIYSSINGAAGTLAKILSWKYFLPLSRLSYSIYLVHLAFPILRTMTLKNPSAQSDLLLVHTYISDLLLSIVLAYFFSITFEVPVFVLDDLIFKKKTILSDKSQKSNNAEQNFNNKTVE